MQQKSLPFEVKDLKEGDGLARVEGYASVFGNIDRSGDVAVAGCFAKTLPTFKKDGLIVWQHKVAEPIGIPVDCYEDAKGLFIIYDLVLELEEGRKAYTALKRGLVKKHSFGYEINDYELLDADNIEKYAPDAGAGDIARAFDYWGLALKELTLYEVSPVSIPCNPLADVTNVKNTEGLRFDEHFSMALAAVKGFANRAGGLREKRGAEGRDLGADNLGRVKELRDQLDALLTSGAKPGEDDGACADRIQGQVKELRAKAAARKATLAANGIYLD